MLRNHTLRNEFPEYEERIHELKISDNHFKKLFEEYEDLNHHLHGLETEMNVSDDTLHELKVKRLELKDQLYELLKG